MPRFVLALPLFALSLACDPFVVLPGGALSGTVAPAPESWAFSDAIDTVQLETRPSDPYSVNIWGVGTARGFYVAAGDGAESSWAQNMVEDPAVRLRIEDAVYELHAVRIEDETEKAEVLAALQQKYDFTPEPEEAAEAWLFRLDPRP